MRVYVQNIQARMNDMSLSLAALSADKNNLEERLAREEVYIGRRHKCTFLDHYISIKTFLIA